MSKLEIINRFFLQWFFIRLTKITDSWDGSKSWGIVWFIIPTTGWTNDYKTIGDYHCTRLRKRK